MDANKDWIRSRKSVRTFDGRALSETDMQALAAYEAPADPFGVPVTLRLLNAQEHGLTSPVIVGAQTYWGVKAPRAPYFEAAVGYVFENACLFAFNRGVGTVMLAASLNRSAFEKAMDLQPNEVMPVASPVGYPAAKRSLRETLMRKGIRADERKPFESLFFQSGFDQPLVPAQAGVWADPLEAVRWAPSAANGQPWRLVLEADRVHFYETRTMKESPLGDIQLLDVGIAMAHLELAAAQQGLTGAFTVADPGLPTPENTRYVITFARA